MRIVTWNCCRGPFARKTELLRPLAADVAVVQECARPPEESARVRWAGEKPRQGIAVLAGEGWSVEPIAFDAPLPRWIVPFRIHGPEPFTLVAVWSLPPYSRSVVQGVEALAEVIAAGPTVVAGDFNSNPVFDRVRPTKFGYARIEAVLRDLGVESAYHAFHGETPGDETRPTYFHQWRREQPFHMDYCFVPRGWLPRRAGVEVGGFDAWAGQSDHRPVTVDVGDDVPFLSVPLRGSA